MTKFPITPVPTDKDPKFTVEITKDILGDGRISMVVMKSPFGTLSYGWRPEGNGFDGWIWEETGGGGAITLPYFYLGRQLFVGLIKENRLNMGGEALCILGGFIDLGESHKKAQAREAKEEADLETIKAKKIPGLPMNSNRLYFAADPNKDEGLHAYANEMSDEMMERNKDGWIIFRSEFLSLHPKAKNMVFMPWQKAIKESADVMAVATIGRLVAMLDK